LRAARRLGLSANLIRISPISLSLTLWRCIFISGTLYYLIDCVLRIYNNEEILDVFITNHYFKKIFMLLLKLTLWKSKKHKRKAPPVGERLNDAQAYASGDEMDKHVENRKVSCIWRDQIASSQASRIIRLRRTQA
jgi:hypothetical protein